MATWRNPITLLFGKGSALDPTAVDDQGNRLPVSATVSGAVQPLVSSTDWHYSTAAGAATITNTTTAVTIKAAGGAALYNTLSYITVSADTLGTATVLSVRDGAGGTVLWAIRMQATAQTTQHFTFPTPLVGSANTLLEILTQTASTGGVYVSAGGAVVG